MGKLVGVAILSLLAVVLSPGVSAAQDDLSRDPNLNPALALEPQVVPENHEAALLAAATGAQQDVVWIAASQFTVSLASAAPTLFYAGNLFFRPSGAAQRYYAQLTVEPGRVIDHLSCVYDDTDPVENIGFQWYRYTTNLDSGESSPATLASFVTAGTPGVAAAELTPSAPETMQVSGAGTLINHYITVDVSDQTSFAGCYAMLADDGPVAALEGKVAGLDGKVAGLEGSSAALQGRVTALEASAGTPVVPSAALEQQVATLKRRLAKAGKRAAKANKRAGKALKLAKKLSRQLKKGGASG